MPSVVAAAATGGRNEFDLPLRQRELQPAKLPYRFCIGIPSLGLTNPLPQAQPRPEGLILVAAVAL